MIKTQEMTDAVERSKKDPPKLISAFDFLPFPSVYVPIITWDGKIGRGALWINNEGELEWQITPMNHSRSEQRYILKDVHYWLG